MIKEIRYLSTDTSDYFQGSGNVVLQAGAYPGMTFKDLRDDLIMDSDSADFGIENWDNFIPALDVAFEDIDLDAKVDTFDHDEMARQWKEMEPGADANGIAVFRVDGEICETLWIHFEIIETKFTRVDAAVSVMIS